MGNRWKRSGDRVTPASLRAEGIVEIGCAIGTSLLYVLTKKKLHMFHASGLPDRALDAYAVALAVSWIENGLPSFEVAANLGISQPTLQHALTAAGYERLTMSENARLALSKNEQRARAKMQRGNRRGKLVHVGAAGVDA